MCGPPEGLVEPLVVEAVGSETDHHGVWVRRVDPYTQKTQQDDARLAQPGAGEAGTHR